MKDRIKKIDQYLLEHYPTVWNTKIVWIFCISTCLHIVFFLLGFIALSNPESLHEYSAKSVFFRNGTFHISVILSILLIVLWLLYLFKNNAFKNFYPTKTRQLFGQFIQYFVIVIYISSFYISHSFGVKTYINQRYPDKETQQNIALTNKTAMFFSTSIEHYTLDNIRFPEPLGNLYCEERSDFIDYDKPHQSFLNENYQFNSLNSNEKHESELSGRFVDTTNRYVFSTSKDSIRTFYYKDSVVDISSLIKTEKPSYYNYSRIFYNNSGTYYDYVVSYNPNIYDSYYNLRSLNMFPEVNKIDQNKYGFELLNRKDPEEIKKLLSDFLVIASGYKIKNNLTADTWFNLVFKPGNFTVEHIIRTQPKTGLSPVMYVADTNNDQFSAFVQERLTDYYLESEKLYKLYKNIDEIKSNTFFAESIHVFIWVSFFLSALIFMFRVTKLRTFIFTLVATGVLLILVALVIALASYSSNMSGKQMEFFSAYFTFLILSCILIIPTVFLKKLKKEIVGVFMNMSLIGFTLWVLNILAIISLYQDDYCSRNRVPGYNPYQNKCTNIFEYLGLSTSFILFFMSIIFIYVYCNLIKKWRALPEG